jgi:predicted DNA-binding transcriptional regulator YafY
MSSRTYEIFHQAVLNKQQIVCTYHGYRREICPHTLGHTKGAEQALSFQFAGQSKSGLPPEGEWRCMRLAEVYDAQLRDGPWRTAPDHSRPQTCVKQIDVEVAFAVA